MRKINSYIEIKQMDRSKYCISERNYIENNLRLVSSRLTPLKFPSVRSAP
jgi:hypothetical protein